jgi:thiamine-monophosphate kinase
MSDRKNLGDVGEVALIKIIEDTIKNKLGDSLIRDDSFFVELKSVEKHELLVLNSDMLVSTTDIPKQMSHYQIGRKSVIMNVSDLIVKGVDPKYIIISLGLPDELPVKGFKDIISGIADACKAGNIRYIGGDLNKSKEIVINPTVFGFKSSKNVIHRTGLETGDFLMSNSKFGLTGVGFDILLNQKEDFLHNDAYERSILSVLEPSLSDIEARILSDNNLASASIDSSDGLVKSLRDLIISNPNHGFEIYLTPNLIDEEAQTYSNENDIPIVNLIFNGGEEFIHLFTINPQNLKRAQQAVSEAGGKLYSIGKVITDNKIIYISNDVRVELALEGFEHFSSLKKN